MTIKIHFLLKEISIHIFVPCIFRFLPRVLRDLQKQKQKSEKTEFYSSESDEDQPSWVNFTIWFNQKQVSI